MYYSGILYMLIIIHGQGHVLVCICSFMEHPNSSIHKKKFRECLYQGGLILSTVQHWLCLFSCIFKILSNMLDIEEEEYTIRSF